MKLRWGICLLGLLLCVGIVTGLDGPALAAPPPTCDVCLSAPIGCPYSSIQAAIDAASDGETIWVCNGTYEENIDFLGKAITVRSMEGAETTVIDAGYSGSVVTFASGEGPDSVLHDLTIRRGRGTDVSFDGVYGGGVFFDSSSPTITDCVIFDNEVRGGGAGGGGGIYCTGASPAFTDCVIEQNGCYWNGGGVHCRASDPTFTRCLFTRNTTSRKGGGIYSDPDSSPTITDCEFSRNYLNGAFADGGGIYFDASPSPTLDGCTFNHNTVSRASGDGDGGAIHFHSTASATLTDCTFIDNSADGTGGGIFLDGSSATLVGCDFIENRATMAGGGMTCYSSSPILDGCIFDRNISESSLSMGGGALYCVDFSSPSLDGCHIIGNEASAVGGGISCNHFSSPSLTGCIISGNTAAQYGGGISCVEYSDAVIAGCTISDNRAETGGGGGLSTLDSSVSMTNCTVTGNFADGTFWDQGGGGTYYQRSYPTITNCTISDNFAYRNGGGILCHDSPLEVVNSILWGDTAGDGSHEIYESGDSPDINYSDVQGGWATGTGNIDVDPSFVGGGDYHLTSTSLCIDAGDPAGGPADDIDGDVRPQHAAYDMGSDEYAGELCIDADGDGYYTREGCGTEADCDDSAAAVHPGAPEVCDGMDNDCDGIVDEGCYPTIRVSTDGSEYTTGETMTSTLQTTTGADPAVVDVYLCLYLPNGIFVFLPSLSTHPVPLLSSWTVVDWGPAAFFRWTFREWDMAGTYYWIALYTAPGTFDIVGVGDYAPFTFTP